MWQWLLWGQTPKLKPKHLTETINRLLASGPGAGEEAFALHEREMKRLCTAAREALLREPALLEIRTSASVVVVGDLHGQFCDLQRIFQQLGQPGSDDKVWVFLGDYIDRGPMGLEIVATLLALKLRHPASIHLIRGNHECSEITVLFGFCGECQRRSTLAAWEMVMQVFDALPLAALVNDKVFLCHGGISPYLKRPQDINNLRRPVDVNPNGSGLMSDLLWADPSPHVEGWSPNPRGVSFLFGLDVAREWMRSQGVRAIVRAHMVQQTGYEVLGDNEVITVFSASDYRQSGNTGAVLMIAPSLDFQFVTFPAIRQPGSDAWEHEGIEAQLDAAAAAAAAAAAQAAPPPEDEAATLSSPEPASPAPLPAAEPASAGAAQRSLPCTGAPAPELAAAADGSAAAGAAAGATQAEPAGPEPAGVAPQEAAAAAAAPTPAAQAMQQEEAEERVVMHKVASDKDLAALLHRRSQGLQELEALTGGSRVPAEALARSSMGAQS